jgi:hypothetical protein
MRGGSQPHLMRCSDGNYYVVKFQNNPQHRRILVNELLGSALAQQMGLPVPEFAIVDVSETLIGFTPDLCIELLRGRLACGPGLQFGSRLPSGPHCEFLIDCLPNSLMAWTANVRDFIGMLVFDKWTCNTDHRQVVFAQLPKTLKYKAWMIDEGFCFNEQYWNFPDAPRRSLYDKFKVYDRVLGIETFEPWLEKLDSLDLTALLELLKDVPAEWYGSDLSSLERLLEKLASRRQIVRDLLCEAQNVSPHVFPNWLSPGHVRTTLPSDKCKAEISREIGNNQRGGRFH